MPQLIAMVIVVVGAMIYMFQTFGGTGDKIEGIAQKATVLTEINNIKNGVQLAVRSEDIFNTPGDDTVNPVIPATVTTLRNLADLEYFADQINTEIANNNNAGNGNSQSNTYSAISFGGEDNPGMLINLITQSTTATGTDITRRPGLRVELIGELADNAGFLEAQITADLAAVASIDRISASGEVATLDQNGDVPAARRAAAQNGTATGDTLTDGIFTIYYKDMPANVQQ